MFRTHHWTKGSSLTYKIPVLAGTYKVGLLHAESYMDGPGQRVCRTSINGVVKERAYDVFARRGKNRADYEVYYVVKSVGGFITISFRKIVQNPFINGIFISGPRASLLAIAGREDGSC